MRSLVPKHRAAIGASARRSRALKMFLTLHTRRLRPLRIIPTRLDPTRESHADKRTVRMADVSRAQAR
jgi:hypothetical protein